MKTTRILSLAGLMFSLAVTAMAQDAAEKKQPAAPEPASTPATNEPVKRITSETEAGLRLNFRGVPLDMVLSYLSDAAGFIIVMEGEPRGKVDVWSNQPLTKDEAVDLLNTILSKNGYAAIRNGRTLKIVNRDEAKTKDIPVRSGSDPELIPKTEEMITQVIPVRYANATQLTKDLQPLMPTYAIMTANESGNALVITDTQTSVRRMVEIVKALDTSIASVSTIKVFPLRYADAKTLADAVKELFAPPTTQGNSNDRRNRFFNQFGGGGGPFGGGGPGGGNSSSGSSGPGANTKVTALADERANSLVVSAPEDTIPTIEKLVAEMDVSVTDVTEFRVFRLRNSDPTEMAELFGQLFPDETAQNRNNQQNQFGFRFGGFGGGNNGGGRGNRNNQSTTSERDKKMGQVKAVADQRTSSLIISASTEMMPQIAQMVEQLDSDASRRQKVFVYSLENADVQQVEQIVRGMFERTTTTGNRNNQNQNSALNQRSQQNAQQQGQNNGNNGGGGNSGFGGGGGGGGGSFR